MKVDLENITLGHSPLTDEIFAGTVNKGGKTWRNKKNVTNEFIDCCIKRWEGQKEIIQAGENEWEISVRKINNNKEVVTNLK